MASLESPYLPSSIFQKDSQLEETFNLLYINLIDFLDNKSNALYEVSSHNILFDLLEKIRYIKSYELDDEDIYKLNDLTSEIYSLIKSKFITEFEEIIDIDVLDNINNDSINFIYYFFYNNRFVNIISYINNYIDINKKKLINKYKNIKSKDYEYNRLKSEFPNMDSDVLYIYTNLTDIIDTVLSDEETTIHDFASVVGLQYNQLNLISNLFEFSGMNMYQCIISPIKNVNGINNLTNQVLFSYQFSQQG